MQTAVRKTKVQDVLLPPHSVEAEQALIGGLLLDNRAWDSIGDRVTEADFYRNDHQLIFSAIRALIEQSLPCDAVTVSEYLEKQGVAEQSGGLVYVANIVRDTPSAANVLAYASIVRDRSIMRGLIHTASNIATTAYNPEGRTPAEIIDDADRQIFSLAERGARVGSNYQVIGDLLGPAIDRLDELSKSGSDVTGLATGFTDLDRMTSGPGL